LLEIQTLPSFGKAIHWDPTTATGFAQNLISAIASFFAFPPKKVIVYVWVNDEFTLRKAGSKTDAYALFKSMLNAGDPRRTLEALLKHAKEMRRGGEKKDHPQL